MVTLNDTAAFGAKLCAILAVNSLWEIISTQYHSGSHIICDFCTVTVKNAASLVVYTAGQLGEPAWKCAGLTVNCT